MRKLILIIVTVIVIIFLRIIYSPPEITQETVKVSRVTRSDASKLFPQAHSVIRVEGSSRHQVLKSDGEVIGEVIHSSPRGDKVTGYSGPTPLIIGISKAGKIAGVQLLENEETPEFVETVTSSGLLERWKGLRWEEAAYFKVDAVTGATLTSKSIIKTFKHSLLVLAHEEPYGMVKLSSGDLAAILLAFLALIVCVFPVKHKGAVRTMLLAVSLIYLGFWRGELLSIQIISQWIKTGAVVVPSIVLFFIACLTIIVSLFTGKALYCYFLCPFGALQEFIYRLSPWKSHVAETLRKALGKVRGILLAVAAILLLLRVSSNLTDFEPFTIFIIGSASTTVIILSVISFVLSLFVSRPWCNFLCPTGAFFDIFRIKKNP